MRSRVIALAASAALFCSPALAGPTYSSNQYGTVGTVTPCVDTSGNTINCVVPSVSLTDTSGNPVGPGAVVSTNASSTVTTGGTYQTVFAASTTRRGCTIQNPTTATEILSVRVKSVAVFTLPIGATFQCGSPSGVVISDLIEVTATTTAHAFTAVSQ